MAFASLFTLLDDIVSVLDDVAVMTKMAAKKTAGVVGDDLALNANQVTGAAAERELPIVWAVAKGSFCNKAVLVPLALAVSYFAPWLITPLLMVGGTYLCFEGVEKLWHSLHRHSEQASPGTTSFDEKTKIRGAVRTDFILSAEIIIIALGVVADMAVLPKAVVLALIGAGMTVLVYGVVAVIVKMDDMGLWLQRRQLRAAQRLGRGMVAVIPWLMRLLALAGMAAMFLVGGGIIAHGLPEIHHFLSAHHWHGGLIQAAANMIVGVLSGTAACLAVQAAAWLRRKISSPSQ